MKIVTGQRVCTAFLLAACFTGSLYAGRYDRHNAIIHKAVKAYRGMKRSPVGWQVLGYSDRMNEIYYREFGTGEKTLLVIGGMHGDEPAATISVIKFGEYLNAYPELLTGHVLLVPCVNPDGLMRGTRTNGRGIDLNRNFPSPTWEYEYKKDYNNPGRLPATEPETVIMVNAVYDYKPWMIIQMHQPFGKLYTSGDVPVELYNNMSMLSGYDIACDIGYDTPGSFGSYAGSRRPGIPVLTFEIGSVNYEPDYGRINLALLEAANYR